MMTLLLHGAYDYGELEASLGEGGNNGNLPATFDGYYILLGHARPYKFMQTSTLD